MKNFFWIVFGCLVLMGRTAVGEDLYMYWMVGESAAADLGVDSLEGYTARIAETDGNYLNLYAAKNDFLGTGTDAADAQLMGVFAQLGESPSTSFFVEIWNDTTLIGRSSSVLYSDLLPYISTMEFSSAQPTGAYSFGSFSAAPVPEPTSALLVLLGCAALALRRKHA